jgi:hypothetical protein
VGAGNPGPFAPTSWWRTQSRETGLPRGDFPVDREKNRDSCLKMGFGFDSALNSGIQNNGLQDNSLRNKTEN